jgi:peptidyl-prolyl cis-trans isomerase SurA
MQNRWLIFVTLLLFTVPLHAAEVLDRIVASVNGHVILQSDWNEELEYQSLMGGHEMQAMTAADRTAALDRLVDRELLSEQVSTTEFGQTTADEIDKQLQQLKSDYVSNAKTSWSAAVASHSFTEIEIRDRIALELNQLKLIDTRLRPLVQIDNSAVEDYYRRKFLPELQRSGAQPIPLAEAAPKIREVLIQQKINEALPSWLQTLRSQAKIRVFDSTSLSSDRGQ